MATTLYRVNTVFTGLTGAPYLSTFYFDSMTGTTQDVLDATGDFWTAIRGVISTGLGWQVQNDVPVIDTTTGAAIAWGSGTGASDSGSEPAEVMPFADQLLVQWFTGVVLAGRRLRGHTFIPGLTQTANDAGHVLDATQTTIYNAANALIGDTATILEIYSRKNGVGESVTTALVSNDWAVLRSRRD